MSTSDIRRFKAEIFKALSNPLRIAILDTLRSGEQSVMEMTAGLGMEQAALSQQLAVLRARNIVRYRKQGNFVYYSVSDPVLFAILDDAASLFRNHLINLQGVLEGSPEPHPTRARQS